MTIRRIALLGSIVAAVTFAGCSSSKNSTPSAASPTASSSTTSAPSTSDTTTSGATSSAPPSTLACKSSQLSVSATGNSGAGHIGVILHFKNTSDTPCTLMGYPGVAGLDASGNQVVQAQRTLNGYFRALRDGQGWPVVVLTKKEPASAFVEGTDVPTGNATSCPTYPKLLVTPPNTTQSVTIDMSMPGCSPLQVHPVVPGTTGSLVN
jgi:hypothetical protein